MPFALFFGKEINTLSFYTLAYELEDWPRIEVYTTRQEVEPSPFDDWVLAAGRAAELDIRFKLVHDLTTVSSVLCGK